MAERFRSRRARLLVVLGGVTLFLILLGFWAGGVTEGFWGALRIGGIAIIFSLLVWALAAAIAIAVGWIWKGEPRGRSGG